MKPTIGRIVHYTDCGRTKAAIITATRQKEDRATGMSSSLPPEEENHYEVDLHIFHPFTVQFQHGQNPAGIDADNVPFSQAPGEHGHWNWPPRE